LEAQYGKKLSTMLKLIHEQEDR